MRRRTCTIALILVCSLTGSAIAQPGESSESTATQSKEAEAASENRLDVPIIGPVMGATIEDAFSDQRILRPPDDDGAVKRMVVDIWTDPRTFGLRQEQPAVYCPGFAKSQVAAIYTRDDKIARIDLHYVRLKGAGARRLVERLGEVEVITEGPAIWEARLTVQGVRILVTLRRDATWSRALRPYANVFPDTLKPNGGAILSFEIIQAEWYLWHHEVTPQIAKAMRSGSVIVGMDEDQVRDKDHRMVQAAGRRPQSASRSRSPLSERQG